MLIDYEYFAIPLSVTVFPTLLCRSFTLHKLNSLDSVKGGRTEEEEVSTNTLASSFIGI